MALSVQWNGSYVTNSKIYKWNSSTNLFEDSQSILTYGAFNIEYFSIGIKNYLAVANCYNGSTYNLNSFIYRLD